MTVEVYVHPDGDDSATGMPEAPLRTVVAGVSAVAAGGIVNLQGGTFYGDVEIVDINPTSSPVAIRAGRACRTGVQPAGVPRVDPEPRVAGGRHGG